MTEFSHLHTTGSIVSMWIISLAKVNPLGHTKLLTSFWSYKSLTKLSHDQLRQWKGLAHMHTFIEHNKKKKLKNDQAARLSLEPKLK